jgi:hypothetical protein
MLEDLKISNKQKLTNRPIKLHISINRQRYCKDDNEKSGIFGARLFLGFSYTPCYIISDETGTQSAAGENRAG